MSNTYRAWNPCQSWLFPPSPQDWLPQGDLVYFLMDVVESLDISSITAVYEKNDRGFPPFHPRMMLCLLIYRYAMGVRSSRQIVELLSNVVDWPNQAACFFTPFSNVTPASTSWSSSDPLRR